MSISPDGETYANCNFRGILNSSHWELPDWPRFRWDASALAQPLAEAHLKQGRFLGRMERLGFALRAEAELLAVTEEALKNAEIEGEIFNRASVRSREA